MKIALAVDGTRGDVFPMLALAERFRAAGHDSILCAPPDFRSDCELRGLELRPFGIDVREFLSGEARALAGGALGFAAAGRRYFDATVDRQFERLPEATADVDLVLGAGVCFAGASAAELHGIPYRLLCFCPLLLPSAQHAPFIVPTTSSPPWLNRLLWSCVVPLFGRLIAPKLNRHRRRLGLPAVRSLYGHLLSRHPVLAADPILAPLPEDCPLEVQRVACLHPTTGPALPEKLSAFLDAGPPPVYFGFGSMPDPDPAATTRMLLSVVESIGCRALLSSGWAGLGDAALPESVLRVEAVNHNQLFPRTAAIVHHGGAGTTTTAARSGVPQIVVPHGADQYYWASRVHGLGLGPTGLPRSRLAASTLGARLRATLDVESIELAARELGSSLRSNESQHPDPLSLLEPARTGPHSAQAPPAQGRAT
jgi:UDP:flavonoid glycosyltransferase YjiC (YdhE family)